MGDRRARDGASRGVGVCAQIGREPRKRWASGLRGGRLDGVQVRDVAARKAHGDALPTRYDVLVLRG
jgi:hypothetical protein